jgi:hypothetical protein
VNRKKRQRRQQHDGYRIGDATGSRIELASPGRLTTVSMGS